MRILVLTQFFTPEIGATSTRLHTFAAGLAARGHVVEVVCEVPNHPQGIVSPEFRGRWVRRARCEGFHVARVWVRTRPQKSSNDRLAFYATFAASAAAWGTITVRPDVILTSSPPLPAAAAAAAVARLRNVPWVLDVRDLWPDVAVAVGELRGARLLKLAQKLERLLYRDAAAITTVTDPFTHHIAGLVDAPGKITLIPNGTTRLWTEAAERPADPSILGFAADRFVWTFAGNLGLAQDLETAVCAAELLGDEFQLLLLGDGAAKTSLQTHASKLASGNVEFRRQVPPSVAAEFLRASDALLVSLGPDPTLASFVPSKLFDFCATGTPVVVAAAGEPARLAEEAQAALTVPPGDPPSLAAAVRRLRDKPELGATLGANGRRFGAANFREDQVARLEDVLLEAAQRRGRK